MILEQMKFYTIWQMRILMKTFIRKSVQQINWKLNNENWLGKRMILREIILHEGDFDDISALRKFWKSFKNKMLTLFYM